MNLIQIIFFITGIIIVGFFGLFAVTSIRESKPRAAIISMVIFLIFCSLWFGIYFYLSISSTAMLSAVGIILLFTLLLFLPLGRRKALEIGAVSEKVDERDVIFAREEYKPGTEKYDRYYAMRPEKKEIDDRLRKLPELLAPGGKLYDSVQSEHISHIFTVIEGMLDKVDGPVNPNRHVIDPDEMTDIIKDLTIDLGAVEVGIAELNPMWVYSHVGRGPEKWGAPIANNHKYVIPFTVEMDFTHVETAPDLPITEESATSYLFGANISIALASYIRSLGWPARAHMAGSNYQIMLPPVAHDAGLGELGRMGYLISPQLGARVRLGAVTTDLPLLTDDPISFGVQDFCERCLKCAENCPSGAIPLGSKTDVRGVIKWQLNIEKCLHYWRMMGTDCGLCMKVCPYSHPEALVHDITRAAIKRSVVARQLAVWADDLFYGRKANYPKF